MLGSYMFTVVDKVSIGFFKLLLSALIMLPVGLILFALSFVVLWSNEGLPERAEIAESAMVVAPEWEAGHDGDLVSVTGPLNASHPIADSRFFAPIDAVSIVRIVEQYAWIEEVTVSEEKKLGGGREQTFTYEYRLGWTSAPMDSDEFREPAGHRNPPMSVVSEGFHAPRMGVGDWYVSDSELVYHPNEGLLMLDDVELTPEAAELERRGNTLYMGTANPDMPQLGDERVRFYYVPAGPTVTLFGEAQGETIAPHTYKGLPFIELVSGDRAGAIETLQQEDTLRLWLLRIVGFIAMWGGLWLLFSLLYAILDIIPAAGTFARIVMAGVTFLLAAPLSAATIGLAIIGHNTAWTVGILGALFTFVIFLYYGLPLIQRKDDDAPQAA